LSTAGGGTAPVGGIGSGLYALNTVDSVFSQGAEI